MSNSADVADRNGGDNHDVKRNQNVFLGTIEMTEPGQNKKSVLYSMPCMVQRSPKEKAEVPYGIVMTFRLQSRRTV